MKTMIDSQGRRLYLHKISEKTELCKGFLLVCFGYIFCYMFMLDYTVEGMNIFHRESTASGTVHEHPVLFGIWLLLCATTFFLNLDILRRKYSLGHMKTLVIMQYAGLIFLGCIYIFRLPSAYPPYEKFSDVLQFALHVASTVISFAANGILLLLVILIKFKEDKRWKPFVIIAAIFVVLVGVGFATITSVFMETVPLMFVMAILYMLNYTDVVKPKEASKA